MSVCPETVGNWSSLPQNECFFRSDRGLQSYLIQLDRKSADGDFLQLNPWRRGKQFWIYLGESSDSFWGEEDQRPTFSGQTLMRTYWKVLFNGLQIQLQENWPEVYDLIQFIVCIVFCFYLFSSWGNLPLSRVIGACPVTTDCTAVAMSYGNNCTVHVRTTTATYMILNAKFRCIKYLSTAAPTAPTVPTTYR